MPEAVSAAQYIQLANMARYLGHDALANWYMQLAHAWSENPTEGLGDEEDEK